MSVNVVRIFISTSTNSFCYTVCIFGYANKTVAVVVDQCRASMSTEFNKEKIETNLAEGSTI